jgi:ABC-type glycerol-3-phosphate transport system substrate-binding protein
MFWIKKWALLVGLLVVGVLLLSACGADEPSPAAVEQVVDTQATADAEAEAAAKAAADAEAKAEAEAADAAASAVEEPEAASEPSGMQYAKDQYVTRLSWL